MAAKVQKKFVKCLILQKKCIQNALFYNFRTFEMPYFTKIWSFEMPYFTSFGVFKCLILQVLEFFCVIGSHFCDYFLRN